jgi:hypothetical protein
VDQGADPGLARGDDLPQQRVRPSAEPGEDLLQQVSGVIAGLAEVPGPGQRARDGNGEHEDERVAAPPPLPRVRDQGKHLQQTGDFPGA